MGTDLLRKTSRIRRIFLILLAVFYFMVALAFGVFSDHDTGIGLFVWLFLIQLWTQVAFIWGKGPEHEKVDRGDYRPMALWVGILFGADGLALFAFLREQVPALAFGGLYNGLVAFFLPFLAILLTLPSILHGKRRWVVSMIILGAVLIPALLVLSNSFFAGQLNEGVSLLRIFSFESGLSVFWSIEVLAWTIPVLFYQLLVFPVYREGIRSETEEDIASNTELELIVEERPPMHSAQ